MTKKRNWLRHCVVILLATGAAEMASGQVYPNRAVRFVIPYPAGGGTDLTARPSPRSWARSGASSSSLTTALAATG